jgi:hypothetical protein
MRIRNYHKLSKFTFSKERSNSYEKYRYRAPNANEFMSIKVILTHMKYNGTGIVIYLHAVLYNDNSQNFVWQET